MKIFLCDGDYIAADNMIEALDWQTKRTGERPECCQEIPGHYQVDEADPGDPPRLITLADKIARDLQDPRLTWPRYLGTHPKYC
jgi:hypothetical protein